MLGAFLRLALVLVAWSGIIGLAVFVAWRIRVREMRRGAPSWRAPHDLAEHLFLAAHSARKKVEQ